MVMWTGAFANMFQAGDFASPDLTHGETRNDGGAATGAVYMNSALVVGAGRTVVGARRRADSRRRREGEARVDLLFKKDFIKKQPD